MDICDGHRGLSNETQCPVERNIDVMKGDLEDKRRVECREVMEGIREEEKVSTPQEDDSRAPQDENQWREWSSCGHEYIIEVSRTRHRTQQLTRSPACTQAQGNVLIHPCGPDAGSVRG